MEKLVLIDGSSMIFRAYFAIPSNLATKDGLHTNAIYGFATMFRKLLAGRVPDYGAVIFDPPGPTFRDRKYEGYKAQRAPMANELVEQLPWIDRLVAAHRFRALRVPGFEADDVIGTLTRLGLDRGMEVVIVSADKDFAQLVGERVRMFDAVKDVTYDAELVKKKWGVPPHQFVDLLALMGDSVDNIPGVAGIGSKGAADLLERFGSLDGILAGVAEIKGRAGRALVEHKDDALLSRDLARIDQSVPLPEDAGIDDLRYVPPAQGELDSLYKELEFFSLLQGDASAAKADESRSEGYELCGSADVLEAALSSGSSPARPAAVFPVWDLPYVTRGEWVGLAISTEAGRAVYVPAKSFADRLRPWLEDPARPKIGHNVKQLFVLLARHGISLRGIAGDTMLASFLLDPAGIIPHRLDQIAREYLQRTIRQAKDLTGTGQKESAFSELPPGAICPWACQQADAIGESWAVLAPKLEAAGQMSLLVEHDIPLSWVLGRMELTGILVDRPSLESMGVELAERLKEIEREVFRLAGHEFNIGSPKQLGTVLFDELGLPVVKRTKTGYSTDSEVLERLAPKHEIAHQVVEQRRLAKLINTYTDVLPREVNPKTGRIHASFQQTVGVTGRLITTDPDLQRTPVRTPEGRRIRQAFIADEGCRLISADWSQIELRVLAHFSKDEVLCESFRKGLDIHRRTASELFGCAIDAVTKAQRETAKTVNFATIYGQGANALGQILGIPKRDAKRYIDQYFETYSGVQRWRDRTIEEAHEKGWVATLLGRRRYIAELSSNNFVDRQTGERMALNSPIQGSAADICKLAMLEIDREIGRRGLGAKMLLQVHDELVFDVPLAEVDEMSALVRVRMERPCPLEVPLAVEVGAGASWAEAH